MDWALQRVDDPERRLGAVMYAINNSQEADFASLFAVVEGLADRQLVEAAQTQLQERVVAAQQSAARRAAQLAEEERQHRYQNLIHQDPTAAFAQIATDLSLTESNVAQLDVAGQSALLSALSGMMWRIAGGQAATLPPLATAVLERAVDQQRLGVAGDYGFRNATTQYRQLPLLTATSPAEFWQHLAELDDGSEMIADTISLLYESWRDRHIRTNTRQRKERALASATANRLIAAAPEDFVVRASAGTAVIGYGSVDELVGDMWQYFVPTLGGGPATGQQSRGRLLDNADVAARLDALNQGYDARNMQRLEAEIRSWALSEQPDPYIDEEARGGTRISGPGLFSKHGITVERGVEGSFALRFVGGGSGTGDVELAERFAAFTNKPLIYDGPLSLSYTLLPPSNITELPLRQAAYWTEDTLGAYELPLPVEQIERHLGGIINAPVDREQILHGLAEGAPQLGDSGPTAMVTVLELERPSGAAAQSLPSVTVSVQGDDPTRHSEVAAILLAAQSRRQTEHSDGWLNGQVFTFHTEPAARITAVAERQKPAVVSSQRPSDGEGIAVVEVFATPTMPETVVVYYVGDSDPRDSIDAARAIVSSRMAGAETAAVQQPNIVLVGHPGRGVDNASFADGLNRAICNARCDKPADRRWQLPSNATLFVQAPPISRGWLLRFGRCGGTRLNGCLLSPTCHSLNCGHAATNS
ncbi:MAG: hypothetical protein DLM55_02155 [Acidimicrobiales bacterium]|nr:MAG: hypothetical protein DLM55_02155 [Acidimicrobiales bacterium]